MIATELKRQEQRTIASIFQHILIAVDFSEASRRALQAGLVLASEYGARVSVLHVSHADWRYEMLANPSEVNLEKRDLQQRVAAQISGSEFAQRADEILIEQGPVARVIRSAIAKSGAELLIVGTRGLGGWKKLALGSVAEEVVRTAECPVLTIGPDVDVTRQDPGLFHTILFATDFGRGSEKLVPLVLTLAERQDAKLILLHMIPPMPASASSLSAYAPATTAADELREWEGSLRKRSLRELQQWLPRETHLRQEPEYIVGTEFFPEGILVAAEKYNAGLIVMGATRHGSGRVAAHFPWTIVHEIMVHAKCPVLTMAG